MNIETTSGGYCNLGIWSMGYRAWSMGIERPYQLLWVTTSNEGSCLNGGSSYKYDRVFLTGHLISE